MEKRASIAALVLILLAATCLRVYRLGEPCLTRDEASSWRVSTYPFTPLLWHCAANVHPPGYFLILKGWTGAFGDSPVALRGLSVAFGVAAVAIGFPLAAGLGVQRPDLPVRWSAGVIAACFLAVAPLQVHLSQTTRMYSLGVLCAGITAWLLLRALNDHSHLTRWWLAYGAAAGLFSYVHHYAFFTLAGQGVFAIGVAAVHAWRQSWRECRAAGVGYVMAIALAGALYSPWLPAFIAQTEEVSAGYWIEEADWRDTAHVFSRWMWGDDFGLVAGLLGVALVTGAAAVVIRCGDVAGICFLVQAAAPWCFALVLSWWGPTAILQERYLCFAQFSFLCFVARVLVRRFPGSIQGITTILGATTLLAGAQAPTEHEPPESFQGLPFIARVIAHRYEPGDLIAVGTPGDVNLIRYYLDQNGVVSPQVRTTVRRFDSGGEHQVHVGSLSSWDILWGGHQWSSGLSRCWRVTQKQASLPPIPAGMTETFRYGSWNDSNWTVTLYEGENRLDSR